MVIRKLKNDISMPLHIMFDLNSSIELDISVVSYILLL